MPSQKYNKLAGKHVLIIGGTSGIGFAVAEASIESGASVTISSSSSSRVYSAVEALKRSYPTSKVTGYECDLSRPTLERDLEALFETTGTLDHIVFTAGDKIAPQPLQGITLETLHVIGQSSIVLTTGSVAEHPVPNWPVMASYCAGLHGMTRNLAIDLKPIRVNLVSPGAVDTELWKDLTSKAKDEMFKIIGEKVPTGRVGRSEDVAEAYLWLMKYSNVTGTIASSDSGGKLV